MKDVELRKGTGYHGCYFYAYQAMFTPGDVQANAPEVHIDTTPVTRWVENILQIAVLKAEANVIPINSPAEFSEQIHRIKELTGWSLRQIAIDLLRSTHTTVNRLATGKGSPRPQLSRQIYSTLEFIERLNDLAEGKIKTLNWMLLASGHGDSGISSLDAFQQGNLGLAIAIAARVVKPRTHGSLKTYVSPFDPGDETVPYLDEA